MTVADFNCATCKGSQFTVRFTGWFYAYMKSAQLEEAFRTVVDPVIPRVVDRIAEAISSHIRQNGFDLDWHEIHNNHPWVYLDCSTCGNADARQRIEISEQLWKAFERQQSSLEMQYCSDALGIDCFLIRPMITYRDWLEVVDSTLKVAHPKDYAHIKNVENIGQTFAPDKGGGEFDHAAWLYLLNVVASGIATNLIYDLLKGTVHRIGGRIRLLREDKAVRKARSKLEKDAFYQLRSPPTQLDDYSADILSIIASMPTRKRARIVDEIARQHAKNVKRLLSKATNKSARTGIRK